MGGRKGIRIIDNGRLTVATTPLVPNDADRTAFKAKVDTP